jgi:hypothetical protein
VIMSVPAYEVIVARTCRVDHMMYINVEAGVACERMSTVSSNDKRRPVRTHAHTHTHTHTEREREREEQSPIALQIATTLLWVE